MAAVPVAAVIFAIATAVGSAPTPKVAFEVKMRVSGEEIRASGTTYLRGNEFTYKGGRLNFTGTLSGDEVRIDGKVSGEDRSQARDFGASGQLADNRMSATLNGLGGSRLGTLRLELLNP